jgi:hypothetical protein
LQYFIILFQILTALMRIIIAFNPDFVSAWCLQKNHLPELQRKPAANMQMLNSLRFKPAKQFNCAINKPGGPDSRDQSRSRLRFLDLSRSTFEKCRDYPYCQDNIFFSQSRFLKLRLLNWDLASSRFLSSLSRLSRLIEIFKICRDFSRFLDFCLALSH